ncbi:MAG: site-specific integrase, partial [Gemmatimonadaceae bacterium]
MRPKPKRLPSMRANLRLRHFSPRTEEAYTPWTRRFVRFHGMRHPAALGAAEVKAFLIHLTAEREVAPSTKQRQRVDQKARRVACRDVGQIQRIRASHAR